MSSNNGAFGSATSNPYYNWSRDNTQDFELDEKDSRFQYDEKDWEFQRSLAVRNVSAGGLQTLRTVSFHHSQSQSANNHRNNAQMNRISSFKSNLKVPLLKWPGANANSQRNKPLIESSIHLSQRGKEILFIIKRFEPWIRRHDFNQIIPSSPSMEYDDHGMVNLSKIKSFINVKNDPRILSKEEFLSLEAYRLLDVMLKQREGNLSNEGMNHKTLIPLREAMLKKGYKDNFLFFNRLLAIFLNNTKPSSGFLHDVPIPPKLSSPEGLLNNPKADSVRSDVLGVLFYLAFVDGEYSHQGVIVNSSLQSFIVSGSNLLLNEMPDQSIDFYYLFYRTREMLLNEILTYSPLTLLQVLYSISNQFPVLPELLEKLKELSKDPEKFKIIKRWIFDRKIMSFEENELRSIINENCQI